MPFHLVDLIGIAAAAAGLYAAQSKTIIPLRAAAIAASLLAILYGALQGAVVIVIFAAALFVLNAWRLYEMLKLIREISAAAKGDMNVDWLLPYTRPKAFKAGHMLMKRGDYATAAYYIASGEVEIVELDQSFGKGTLLGEIGLFAPDGLRVMSVRCTTDIETAVIDYDQFRELYFANPQFGFRLLHLIVARLLASRGPTQPGVPT
jgi:CRP/FNR family cyclic AMP-dependent transcriptional regulator